MTTASTAHNESLRRQLSTAGIWVLAINSVIGAGIFGVPAAAAALTASWSPLVYLACAALLLLVMACFAEVSSYFQSTGGPALYVQTAFGRFWGFQTGWGLYMARATAFAAGLNLLVDSAAHFWSALGQGGLRVVVFATIVGALAWQNMAGVRGVMRTLGVLTILKLLPLVALVAVGMFNLETTPWALASTSAPSLESFGQAVLLVIYAFVGWEAALVPAGEAQSPHRSMPRALFLALAMVTVLYVGLQVVSVAALPQLAESPRALVDLGNALLGQVGALGVTLGVLLSVGGNIASTMMTAPRLTYALARDGSLPRWFAAVDVHKHTPMRSIGFFAVLVFGLAVYGSFVWLAAISALVRLLIYMGTVLALPVLRRHHPHDAHSFRAPGGHWLPVVAFLVCAGLLMHVEGGTLLATAAFLSIGALLYACVRRGGTRRGVATSS